MLHPYAAWSVSPEIKKLLTASLSGKERSKYENGKYEKK